MGFGHKHFNRDVGDVDMTAKEQRAAIPKEARVTIDVAANGYMARCASEDKTHVFESFDALTAFLRDRVPMYPIE